MSNTETKLLVNSDAIVNAFAGQSVSHSSILDFCKKHNYSSSSVASLKSFKDTNGNYVFPTRIASEEVSGTQAGPSGAPQGDGVRAHRHVRNTSNSGYYIPNPMKEFVPFGCYDDVKKIINSKKFLPTLITGESGNGKSQSIIQACAIEAREMVFISITPETDEEDLFGSIGLVDGDTVLNEGPVTTAMRKGAVCVLDELDYATSKISCLQNVLNGGSYTFKKTGEIVRPERGFNVFATMNTKGKGSEDGRYAFTNVLNEAFLDRFPICFEQDYPPEDTEKKILAYYTTNEELINNLTRWASRIRKTFKEGGIEESVSTRRLVNITQMYDVFDNEIEKALLFGISRFNESIKKSFLEYYRAIVDSLKNDKTPKPEEKKVGTDCPF